MANAGAGSTGALDVLSGGIFRFGGTNTTANLQVANTADSTTATVTVDGAGSRFEMLGGATAQFGGTGNSQATVAVQNARFFMQRAARWP